MRDNILKNCLFNLYRDSPEITDMLAKVDFTAVNIRFRDEVLERIDIDTFEKVDSYLTSDEYVAYCLAIDESVMAVTRDLSKIIDFVIEDGGTTH